MPSGWLSALNRFTTSDPSRGFYHQQLPSPIIEQASYYNPYDQGDNSHMETGAYQIGPPPALRASIHNAPQMDQNVGSSSSSGKQRPILTIPHALSNPHAPTSSVSQETEKKHEGDSPTTAPNTLVSATQAQGSQAQQATHGHSQSVATTVVTRNLNRVSRISQAAPSERTRIVSGVDYHDWPQRPEPITAVLSIWQHTVWVFGPLGVVAGAGALGVFVCLHLDVSAAAWMVYIVAYFLLSFLFLGIMGHEMRIFSERKWRKILQKVGGEEGGMALQQQGQHTQGHDNGRLSADGRNYQIGEADETIATEAGESYGPMESGSNAHANKRQSVAFRSPDKPSPIKESQEGLESYVPAYTYHGYGAVASTSPNHKTLARASRAFQQVQRGADYVAHAAQSASEWSAGATRHSSNRDANQPSDLAPPSSTATANGHANDIRTGLSEMKPAYVDTSFASHGEDISMERVYSKVDRPQSYQMTDKEMTIDFANEQGKGVVGGYGPDGSRQLFNGDHYGRGHCHESTHYQQYARGQTHDHSGRVNVEVYAKV